MTTLREAATMALEALTSRDGDGWTRRFARDRAITALRAALAEPVQEPVAIVGTQEDTWKGYGSQWLSPGPPIKTVHMLAELPIGTPLYTAPPQRKPLTEEEIQAAWDSVDMRHPRGNETRIAFAPAIERAHGIGGNDE